MSYENIVVKKGLFIDQHQRPPTDSAVRGKGAPLRCNELYGLFFLLIIRSIFSIAACMEAV